MCNNSRHQTGNHCREVVGVITEITVADNRFTADLVLWQESLKDSQDGERLFANPKSKQVAVFAGCEGDQIGGGFSFIVGIAIHRFVVMYEAIMHSFRHVVGLDLFKVEVIRWRYLVELSLS